MKTLITHILGFCVHMFYFGLFFLVFSFAGLIPEEQKELFVFVCVCFAMNQNLNFFKAQQIVDAVAEGLQALSKEICKIR